MPIREVDLEIRKVNSFFLRVVLLCVLYMIHKYNTNIYTASTYSIAALSYFILLILHFFIKKRFRGLVRSVLDLTLIGVFLIGKDLDLSLNYFPFIVLIFNSINHSSQKSRFLIFLLLLDLTILIIDQFQFYYPHHFIPIILTFFLVIYYIRQMFIKINEGIIKLTGDLFVENINDKREHKILLKVKENIHKHKWLDVFLDLKDIYLFSYYPNNLVFIKGTRFVKDSPKFDTSIIDKLESNTKDNFITNRAPLNINSKKYEHSIWIPINIYSTKYYFLVCSGSSITIIKTKILYGLKPIFNQISRIFYLNHSLDKLNKEQSKIIKQKVRYVLDAQNALHYVKNKLSPITRSIGLMDRLFKGKNLNPEKRKYLIEELKGNKNNKQIRIILDKAELLIKGVDNLLNKDDEIASIKTLIECVRQNWLYHFNETKSITVNIENLANLKINFNKDLFDFIFTDIIENMSKYGGDRKSAEFHIVDENTLGLTFTNSINLDDNKLKNKLTELVTLYNHPENNEIYNRKTHGLSFIRRLLRRKQIKNKIILDSENKLFIFKITFNLHKNENTNI